jgi:hypothetical protein
MHHKLWLFTHNATTNKPIAVIGSFNVSGQATKNWENICILHDDANIASIENELQQLATHRTQFDVKQISDAPLGYLNLDQIPQTIDYELENITQKAAHPTINNTHGEAHD